MQLRIDDHIKGELIPNNILMYAKRAFQTALG